MKENVKYARDIRVLVWKGKEWSVRTPAGRREQGALNFYHNDQCPCIKYQPGCAEFIHSN